LDKGNINDRILASLHEHAVPGAGRFNSAHDSTYLAAQTASWPESERIQFRSAIEEIVKETTPFNSPPNGLSTFQAALLVKMLIEADVNSCGRLVVANYFMITNDQIKRSGTLDDLAIDCLQYLQYINYKDRYFWVQVLDDQSGIGHQSIAVTSLAAYAPANVVEVGFSIFAKTNRARSQVAWNIYYKREENIEFFTLLDQNENYVCKELFIESLGEAGVSAAEFRVAMGNKQKSKVYFAELDYRVQCDEVAETA